MEAVAQITAAVIVIALLGILWWVSRKSQTTNLGWFSFSLKARSGNIHAAPLTVLARSQLTPHHHLHLVQAMEQTLLLCTYPNGSSVVLTKPAERVTGVSDSSELSRQV